MFWQQYLAKKRDQDENGIGSSGTDEGVIAEEKVNISIDSQGSEVTREEEFYGETFAQHASHRFIDTETILLHVEEYSGNE